MANLKREVRSIRSIQKKIQKQSKDTKWGNLLQWECDECGMRSLQFQQMEPTKLDGIPRTSKRPTNHLSSCDQASTEQLSGFQKCRSFELNLKLIHTQITNHNYLILMSLMSCWSLQHLYKCTEVICGALHALVQNCHTSITSKWTIQCQTRHLAEFTWHWISWLSCSPAGSFMNCLE